MFENLKILKDITWKDLVLTVAFGVIVATGINYSVGWIRSIDSKVETVVSKEATFDDKSVIKAYRVNSYKYEGDYLFIEMDTIKIRDCGVPTQFYIKYKDADGIFVKIDELRPMNALKPDGTFGTPNILPVLDDWQRIGYWRLKPAIKGTEFFIYLEHQCPIDLNKENKDKLISSDYQQIAQETISRTYGPFELR